MLLSTAYTVASANRLASAMNESPTRNGTIMQFGQSPTLPAPLLASPRFSGFLYRTSFTTPGSSRSTPGSRSALVTSGRPVDTTHAVFAVGLVSKTLAPRTPFSSHGWWLTGSFPASGVAAYFQSSPPRSFGAGLPAGRRKVLKSWGLNPGPPPYGKSACAEAAMSAPPPTSASATQMRN